MNTNHRKTKIAMQLKDSIARQKFIIANCQKFALFTSAERHRIKAEAALNVFEARLKRISDQTEVNFTIK
jgi:hypothetical protein